MALVVMIRDAMYPLVEELNLIFIFLETHLMATFNLQLDSISEAPVVPSCPLESFL